MISKQLKNKVFYISLALILISNLLEYKNYNNILKLRLHIENYFTESNNRIQKKSFKNIISINIDKNEYQKIKNLLSSYLERMNFTKLILNHFMIIN